MTRTILGALLLAALFMNVATPVFASDEATEVKVVPLVVESINFQYGDSQFGWQRIRTDKYQFEYNTSSGDIRFGIRQPLVQYEDGSGWQGRFVVKLSGTDLTEVRPELMYYRPEGYTYFSVGLNTSNGAASLYNETVINPIREDKWQLGVGYVHTGGLSHETSMNYIGPHLNLELSPELNLDLHWGTPIGKSGDNEAWAILKWTVQ